MSAKPLTRARRGAAFLDKKLGRGWRRRIRRRDLDLSAGVYEGPGSCGCVLAQLSFVGDFKIEAELLGLDDLAIERYGFDIEEDTDDKYDELTEAWRVVLREKP